ncbi:MAG: AAC(3) family N-acetyltransferase [Candidatus Glassbacteria bacterium]|nr:AAC(3) family N-acetyltransferase [Candidatus Glassbacteria bacterium]
MSPDKKINKAGLVADFRALGLGSGHWVAVHSSLKAIGWVEGGPVSVIEALREVVGDGGGIMLPLFIRPRGQLIDLSVTQSYLGLLPETFRNYPGVIRSAHPTHSVGILGPGALEMAEEHRHASYIGRGSPWDHLAHLDGYVLHIGCDWSTSSILHLAEVLAEVPFLDVAYPGWETGVVARHTDGSVISDIPREVPGDSAEFVLVRREMERRGMLERGKVGRADSVIASAREMLDVGVGMMRADPEAFLCHQDDCAVCPRGREIISKLKQKRKGGK